VEGTGEKGTVHAAKDLTVAGKKNNHDRVKQSHAMGKRAIGVQRDTEHSTSVAPPDGGVKKKNQWTTTEITFRRTRDRPAIPRKVREEPSDMRQDRKRAW